MQPNNNPKGENVTASWVLIQQNYVLVRKDLQCYIVFQICLAKNRR